MGNHHLERWWLFACMGWLTDRWSFPPGRGSECPAEALKRVWGTLGYPQEVSGRENRFCGVSAGWWWDAQWCVSPLQERFPVSGRYGKLEGVPLDGRCTRHLYLYNYFLLIRKLSPSTITIFYLPISPGRGLFHGAWTLPQKTPTRNALIAAPPTLFCQFLFRAGNSPTEEPFLPIPRASTAAGWTSARGKFGLTDSRLCSLLFIPMLP